MLDIEHPGLIQAQDIALRLLELIELRYWIVLKSDSGQTPIIFGVIDGLRGNGGRRPADPSGAFGFGATVEFGKVRKTPFRCAALAASINDDAPSPDTVSPLPGVAALGSERPFRRMVSLAGRARNSQESARQSGAQLP